MCGISEATYADPLRTAESGMLRKMTDAMRYRGSDEEGFLSAPGVGFGMRRLTIIDFAGFIDDFRNSPP